jgi:hypothetical protein
MSEYLDCETQIKDREELINALVDLGIAKSHIEVHNSPVALEGYQGDSRQQKAHIVIRRQHVGSASNDIGFEKTENGTYRAWVSAYDKGHGLGKSIVGKKLDQHYAKRVILKQAQKTHGHKVVSCEEKDGKIRIKIRAN